MNCYINTDAVLQHFEEASFALRDFVINCKWLQNASGGGHLASATFQAERHCCLKIDLNRLIKISPFEHFNIFRIL